MSTAQNIHQQTPAPRLYGMLAEFSDVQTLLNAAAALRKAGYKKWDCYTPFPVHGMEKAMGLRPSILPWIAFIGAMGGVLSILVLAPLCNAYLYPMVFSGKPFWGLPGHIPMAFALGILGGTLFVVHGMFVLARLPQFYHPLLNTERFRRVTDDGMFIAVEATDPSYSPSATTELLKKLGATAIEEVRD
ncbi:MAG: DUF3341 domain-containing protein [Phycisphaerae bacterium]